ncbi:hypothetical protein IL54_0241 [Sphingobium sp. ba1]|nr:hypothetical protein IL54_0241 [Sphingobium sp. ba1]
MIPSELIKAPQIDCPQRVISTTP